MARWRLTEPHYIHAKVYNEATEWEYKETDRVTGREKRKRFKVPAYLETETIVCYEGSERDERDVIIEGPPTPAMEPLDEEAKNISAEHAPQWIHPIDSMPGQFSAKDLLETLQKQLAAATVAAPATPVPVIGVSREEFEKVQEQLALLMARNAELEAEQPKLKPGERRKVA